MEREAFLSRVGRASMTAELPSSPAVPAELPDYPPADLVALFRNRAQAVNAVVHGPVSRHGAPVTIAGIVTGHGARTFVSWDSLPASGVPGALTAQGLRRLEFGLTHEDRDLSAFTSLDVGVTGSTAGLAESGSLVLEHGPGRPRLASLLPEIHVALIDVDTISTTLAHWASKNPETAAKTTNLVIITGPSRTGDIEQQLNLGVHGPRHVHIVLVR